ncbi:cyclic nucleotide-binding domain-containing protein [Alphaproteobacteria bacterium]|nr:cyclic nucleotide-binding domain-containing protein [Alphaproteobacteria bacterium]
MLEELKKSFVEFEMKRGETLFEEQDPHSDGFILVDGKIDLLTKSDYSPNSKLEVYDNLEPGEVFGVLKCIYGEDTRLYSAKARTNCKLLFIPKGLLMKKLKSVDPFILFCIRNGR